MRTLNPSVAVVMAVGGALLLTGCEPNADQGGAIAVTSTDDSCEVAATEAPAGTLKFDVTNEGSKVTEFYLLGEDGLRIIGEVENIAHAHPLQRPRMGIRQNDVRRGAHQLGILARVDCTGLAAMSAQDEQVIGALTGQVLHEGIKFFDL